MYIYYIIYIYIYIYINIYIYIYLYIYIHIDIDIDIKFTPDDYVRCQAAFIGHNSIVCRTISGANIQA